MHQLRAILFVDGENLVFRYQDAISNGAVPAEGVVHEADCFVWHAALTQISHLDLLRVCYYTTVTGSDEKVVEIKEKLARIAYSAQSVGGGTIAGQLYPVVFKKLQKSRKTRVVDIQLIIDVMRYSFSNAIDLVYLVSGDQDYLPLISEVMRHGKQVYVAALSSGLGSELRYSCDDFVDLDKYFFKPSAKPAT